MHSNIISDFMVLVYNDQGHNASTRSIDDTECNTVGNMDKNTADDIKDNNADDIKDYTENIEDNTTGDIKILNQSIKICCYFYV
jgi:hypothetical protein